MVVHVSRPCLSVAALLASALAGGLSCAGPDSRDALTIVAFGDSTTASREFEGQPLTVYADILRKELPDKGIRVGVINAGVRGNTTADARGRFATDVLSRQPDVVVIQFGANDAMIDVWKEPPVEQPRVAIEAYAEHLRAFVRTLRNRGARVILMTPNPFRWTTGLRKRYGQPPYRPDDPDGFNVLLETYAAAVRRIAREEDAVLVDVYQLFTVYGQVPGQSVDELLLDGIHPNEAGHRLVARELLEAIRKMEAASTAEGRSND